MSVGTKRLTQGIFWFAFAAFLGASIPHVAWFFRAYEPTDQSHDLVWWGVSYAIAMSIDITIFLLSVTVAGLQRRKSGTGLILSVWVFIIGLALLSWYINYKYADHFIHTGLVAPTTITLPVIGTIGDINPLIASCFQILAIAYTWIADKIVSEETPKTVEELRQEADTLEATTKELARIAAVQATQKKPSWIQRGMTTMKELQAAKQELFSSKDVPQNAAASPVNVPEIAPESGGIDAAPLEVPEAVTVVESSEQVMEPRAAGNPTPLAVTEAAIQEPLEEHTRQQNDGIINGAHRPSSGSIGSGTVTIEEAAKLLGFTIKYTRELRQKGKLKTASRNINRITIKSINGIIEARQKAIQNGEEAVEYPTDTPLLKVVR